MNCEVFCPRFELPPARFPCSLSPSAGVLTPPYNTLQTSVLLLGSSLNRPLAVRPYIAVNHVAELSFLARFPSIYSNTLIN